MSVRNYYYTVCINSKLKVMVQNVQTTYLKGEDTKSLEEVNLRSTSRPKGDILQGEPLQEGSLAGTPFYSPVGSELQ